MPTTFTCFGTFDGLRPRRVAVWLALIVKTQPLNSRFVSDGCGLCTSILATGKNAVLFLTVAPPLCEGLAPYPDIYLSKL